MICKNCGKEIAEWYYTCPFCGVQIKSDENEEKITSNNAEEQRVDKDRAEKANNNKEKEKEIENDRPSYFVSDDEIEIARAKWTILPFLLVWGLFFLVLYSLKYAYVNYTYRTLGSTIDVQLSNFGYIAIWVISIATCLISVCVFLLRRELVITNKKVYGRIGLIGTKEFIIPIEKINYISVRYSIIDRILNSATIHIAPGTIFGVWFKFVANAKYFENELEKLVYNK